jgi:hypothetical protein
MICVMMLYLADSQSYGLLTHIHFDVLFGVLSFFVKYVQPNALVYSSSNSKQSRLKDSLLLS